MHFLYREKYYIRQCEKLVNLHYNESFRCSLPSFRLCLLSTTIQYWIGCSLDSLQNSIRKTIFNNRRSCSVRSYTIIILKVVLYSDPFCSRLAWEANVAIIRKHNLEHDLGLHSYTLGLNNYADLVNWWNFSFDDLNSIWEIL